MEGPKHPVATLCVLIAIALTPFALEAWLGDWKTAIISLIGAIIATAVIYGLVALIRGLGRCALEADLAERRAESARRKAERESYR